MCKTLYSDCGTNFLGADQQLRKLFSSGSKEALDLAHLLLNDGTEWKFNPPGVPHFGRKWEAAVKSVKFHLKRTIGDTLLSRNLALFPPKLRRYSIIGHWHLSRKTQTI